MDFSHSQVVFTQKRVDLNELVDFVSGSDTGKAICTFSWPSLKTISPLTSGAELEAKLILAHHEYDIILEKGHDIFNIQKVAIHTRINKIEEGETLVAIAIAAQTISEATDACIFFCEALNSEVEHLDYRRLPKRQRK